MSKPKNTAWLSLVAFWACPACAIILSVAYNLYANFYRLNLDDGAYTLSMGILGIGVILGAISFIDAGTNSKPRSILAVAVNGLFLMLFFTYYSGYSYDQPKLKVSRIKSDMRTLSKDIDQYFQENGEYPAWAIGQASANGFLGESSMPFNLPTFKISSSEGDAAIFTPSSEKGTFPEDILLPFSEKGATFCYWANAEGYFLLSCGRDHDYDLDLALLDNSSTDTDSISGALNSILYDPTNGTVSSGDIVRISADY